MDNRMIADLQDSYGLTCHHIAPVIGGWLNQKWKVSTYKGDMLVKQFSKQRFNLRQLKSIEAALQRQIAVKEKGVPCPYIRQYKGQAIRLLDDGTAYMVMDFCLGKMESPNTITTTQMHSLGSACGLMHKAFSQLPALSVKGFPIDNRQAVESLWANFRARVHGRSSSTPIEYLKAVRAQEPILRQLASEFFDKLPKGIAHEDFSPDNILFEAECVAAIVDFDRNHYSFTWHDIGRAILSFALQDSKIDIGKVRAFVEGYSQHLVLTLPNIVDALRLSWCIEIPWWIQPEFFHENNPKVVRFKDEMLWLTEHWFELDSLFRF